MSNLILILQNLKKEMLILCISTYIYQLGLHWKKGILKTKKYQMLMDLPSWQLQFGIEMKNN